MPFGQKNVMENSKSEEQTMELGYGNAMEGRSTSLAMDLWIKTNQNALKSHIDPKASLGLFFGKFSNLWWKTQIDGETVATKSC